MKTYEVYECGWPIGTYNLEDVCAVEKSMYGGSFIAPDPWVTLKHRNANYGQTGHSCYDYIPFRYYDQRDIAFRKILEALGWVKSGEKIKYSFYDDEYRSGVECPQDAK